jgi:hypothetical protein
MSGITSPVRIATFATAFNGTRAHSGMSGAIDWRTAATRNDTGINPATTAIACFHCLGAAPRGLNQLA